MGTDDTIRMIRDQTRSNGIELGITAGTTPSTFSSNREITRGKAAKMIKATEDVKPSNVVMFETSDIGWEFIQSITDREISSGLFKVVFDTHFEGPADRFIW
ncbi:hypothetical protein [Sporosarcina sp. P34]|uniref:hypothetical protein n=1 Tax=Sporosarcina sp. P34 TaxID=2048247 RepID=UPI001E50D0DA|nr:hypothetical protein [Sporosarcina sp. P34]